MGIVSQDSTSASEQAGYWAGRKASASQLQEWKEAFDRDGCLLIENVLPPDHVERLRDDARAALEAADRDESTAPVREVLEELLESSAASGAGLQAAAIKALQGVSPAASSGLKVRRRMFEVSHEYLALFELEPIVSLAELLLGDDCHVINNEAIRTMSGEAVDSWHQDDPPHMLVLHGDPPGNIVLPPLVITCNYYLTDISLDDGDGTHVVPGSHLFGASPPASLEGTKWEASIRENQAPAGSVHLHNCQTWHRGGPNPGRPRYLAHTSYGRRIVGHKFYPFINYQSSGARH